MHNIVYTEQFDYGQLRQVLQNLKFEEHESRNEFNAPIYVFYHREAGAMFAVPQRSDEIPLETIYLRIAERSIEDWDIADSATFFRLLREAAQQETQAA